MLTDGRHGSRPARFLRNHPGPSLQPNGGVASTARLGALAEGAARTAARARMSGAVECRGGGGANAVDAWARNPARQAAHARPHQSAHWHPCHEWLLRCFTCSRRLAEPYAGGDIAPSHAHPPTPLAGVGRRNTCSVTWPEAPNCVPASPSFPLRERRAHLASTGARAKQERPSSRHHLNDGQAPFPTGLR